MKMMDKIDATIQYLEDHVFNLLTGCFFWIIAYFAEISGAVHVMAFAFLLDLIIGIANALKINKEKFKMKKVFIQFERFVVILFLVMLLYAMDREMKQNIASIYNGVMWVVSGFLAYSIAENSFSLTGWHLFELIKEYIKKNTKENTDINIDK